MTKSSLGISMVVVVVSIVVMAVPPLDGRTSQLRPLSRRSGIPAPPCLAVCSGTPFGTRHSEQIVALAVGTLALVSRGLVTAAGEHSSTCDPAPQSQVLCYPARSLVRTAQEGVNGGSDGSCRASREGREVDQRR